MDALIEVGGGVSNIAIDGNTLKWSGAVSSNNRMSTDDVINQGIHLYGDVNGAGTMPILIKDNVFDTALIGTDYISSAIFLNTADQSTLGTLSSDVLINDVGNATYAAWLANSTDLGNYTNTGAAYAELRGVGQTASVYTVRDAASGTSDILFQQAAYDYSSIIL